MHPSASFALAGMLTWGCTFLIHNEGSTWGEHSNETGGAWAPGILRDRAAMPSWDFYTTEKWLLFSHQVVSNSLRPHGLLPTRLRCPWDSPGKNTGVGCHFLLQGIFLTQGSNPHLLCLLHWQVDYLPPGKPREKLASILSRYAWLMFVI